MSSLRTPPLFDALAGARSVLIAGAGGGFDIYAGLPLAFALAADGRAVHLANLSSADLLRGDAAGWLAEDVAIVTPVTTGYDDYFPERGLACWLDSQDLPSTIYAFPKVGVQPLRTAYRALVSHLGADAIVLVDGGTDVLLRGDESGLGTPVEDMASLAAVAGMDEIAVRLVASLGFGIDAHHGVNHVQVLENLAALDREGGYLGALSIPRASRESALYRDAVAHARAATEFPSIVHGQVAAACAGEFGNVYLGERTLGSELFVNPLMAVYLTVDLVALARRSLYLDRLENTYLMRQVQSEIIAFRNEITPRTPRAFPH
ncbi:MAG: hypothetical protein QOI35_2239 [Cryptosporangiaceae bacterium]|nr:hypothetical protein [Cryptosporangiaceae bacterium]